ncbi:MAG: hypothetical protein Q3972_04475 [Corynebacterium sp.]|nr:hypothetical protein [Corynebacterium sp.]
MRKNVRLKTNEVRITTRHGNATLTLDPRDYGDELVAYLKDTGSVSTARCDYLAMIHQEFRMKKNDETRCVGSLDDVDAREAQIIDIEQDVCERLYVDELLSLLAESDARWLFQHAALGLSFTELGKEALPLGTPAAQRRKADVIRKRVNAAIVLLRQKGSDWSELNDENSMEKINNLDLRGS